jgi:hypothetical protein
MKEACDGATTAALEFVHKHPVLTAAMGTVIAIGILAILAPWAVEALGFGEFGPVEGKLFQFIIGVSNHVSLTWLRIVCCVVAVDIPRC